MKIRKLKNMLVYSLILIISISAVKSQRGPPPNVTINKCCRIGEHLVRDSSKNETPMCEIGSIDLWYPRIYRVKLRTLFQPLGSAPRNFLLNENAYPKTCINPEYITEKTDNYALFSNGTFHSFIRAISLSTENYCIDHNSALACFPNSDSNRKLTKLKKCCAPNAAYDSMNKKCVILKVDDRLTEMRVYDSDNIEILYDFPKCEKDSYAITGTFDAKKFEEATGVLTLDTGKYLQWTEFCLEHTLNGDINIFTCSDHLTSSEPVEARVHDNRLVLFGIGLLISSVFLVATLAASFLVPSNHHVLHWRCQTHYVACLLIGDFLLAIVQISGPKFTGPLCVTVAIFMHFFFLAAFFWLNTMCFNIWWTFRDFRPTSLEKGQELCRLRIYEVYAWGVPLLIAGVAAILDNLPENSQESFLRPRFGEQHCWFIGNMEMLTYFYGPIGILLIINLMLFASTARQLTCGLWKRDDVKSTTERAALGRVCLKLVVVMGVTWCADVVSWAVGGSIYIWIVTDLVNALQGVFIFIVVGCQPQVWSAVKRLWTQKTGRGMNTTTNGPQHSSSSHGLPSMGESVTNNTFTNTSTKIPLETIC